MPYKNEINVVPHSFNTITVLLDNNHEVQGLDVLEVQREADRYSNRSVADGTSIHQRNESRVGTLRLEVLEGTATTDFPWDKFENDKPLTIAVVDSNAPALTVNESHFRIVKAPMLIRKNDTENVEWIFSANYLKYRGGAYRLESI